jgi:hypothetical protein
MQTTEASLQEESDIPHHRVQVICKASRVPFGGYYIEYKGLVIEKTFHED